MKLPFKQETPNYKSPEIETPYLRAKKEWDDRFGNISVQASNWRFVAVLSAIVSLVLLGLLIASVYINKDRVFVAEVTKAGRVVNVAPLLRSYQPTVAQQEYFIVRFIKLVRELPLDPVVAKKNWEESYQFLTQRSSAQLNTYFQKSNPLKLLGKQTITVKIADINPISATTFQADWVETVVDTSGQQQSQQKYSGVFTIAIKQPTTQQKILQNPLGIYIVDFSISQRET